jgi:hypothetical protein
VERFQELRGSGVEHPVVGCRVQVQDQAGREIRVGPRRVIRPGQRMGDYLFRRRRIHPRGAGLGASMILFETELGQGTPFDSQLSRHDDWDWLLRIAALPGVMVVQLHEVLVKYTVQAASSSARRGWEDSAAWVRSHREYLSPREQADFLLCVTAPIAVRYWDWRGLRAIMSQSRQAGSASVKAWLFLATLIALSLARAARRRLHAAW